MKDTRSASQILFGFLPEQTVDLKNGVWKVKDWRHPKFRNEIDLPSLKREIVKVAAPWRATSMDGGFVTHIEGGAPMNVLTLDENNGVEVEPFPKVWVCKACKRLFDAPGAECPCRAKGEKGQLFFVGYHDKCGTVRAPYIPKCPEHKQARIHFPGTASAEEIRILCPVCNRELRRGFGHPPCDCGQGNLVFQPHRASSVYTARSVVIVNPPSRERIRAIAEAGGPPKALAWILEGMSSRTVEEGPASREALRRSLEAQGFPAAVVEQMIQVAEAAGGAVQSDESTLQGIRRHEAEAEAVTIALAMLESRLRREDLASGTDSTTEIGQLYRTKYPEALRRAGLLGVDLVEKFPVLTGAFGYTRGEHDPGKSKLVPFKGKYGQGYRVYAEIAETEALFVRMDPIKVASWLESQGFDLPAWQDERSARLAILQEAEIPQNYSTESETLGEALLRLVHSYAHRFLRIAAVHAGIDRNALSELLTPLHLGFFIFAAAKGDFVLGGLQAVFESELNTLLDAVVFDEHRCALDPGCLDSGGACMACLHIGEPSCRCFNRYLRRQVLFGLGGYLTQRQRTLSPR